MPELPINVIVIVVICLVVFLAIIALFLGVWNPGKTTITLEASKTSACQMLVSMGCSQDTNLNLIAINNFDADKDGSINDLDGSDNLLALCQNWYNVGEDACKNQVCMCGTSGGESAGPPSPPGP